MFAFVEMGGFFVVAFVEFQQRRNMLRAVERERKEADGECWRPWSREGVQDENARCAARPLEQQRIQGPSIIDHTTQITAPELATIRAQDLDLLRGLTQYVMTFDAAVRHEPQHPTRTSFKTYGPNQMLFHVWPSAQTMADTIAEIRFVDDRPSPWTPADVKLVVSGVRRLAKDKARAEAASAEWLEAAGSSANAVRGDRLAELVFKNMLGEDVAVEEQAGKAEGE